MPGCMSWVTGSRRTTPRDRIFRRRAASSWRSEPFPGGSEDPPGALLPGPATSAFRLRPAALRQPILLHAVAVGLAVADAVAARVAIALARRARAEAVLHRVIRAAFARFVLERLFRPALRAGELSDRVACCRAQPVRRLVTGHGKALAEGRGSFALTSAAGYHARLCHHSIASAPAPSSASTGNRCRFTVCPRSS